MQRALVLSLLALAILAPWHRAALADEGKADEGKPDAAKVEFFEKHIRPVLVEHCYACHSADADNVEGELLLDSRSAMLAGGASGQAIVAGDPASSLIVKALRHDGLEMPPDQRLSDAIVQKFEQWIRDGAVDPRTADTPPPARREKKVDGEEARKFWSLQPPRAQPLPSVHDIAWPQQRIDSFVLARLESMSLAPAEAADRQTLARRAALDLTGLPPDFADVQALVNDARPDAWPRYVDRLLASSAFGERWARLWLDLARYAEDQAHIVGNDRSLCYPNAYLYRDWVIEAFNGDLPYDTFIRQQLAADLLDQPESGPDCEPESSPDDRDLRPLGFLGLGPKYYNRGSPEVMADEWEDRVDVVTRGLLGLTVACARCHDHKYDPIPTEDYYALAGVFASTAMFNRPQSDSAEKKDSGDAKKPEEAMHIVRDGKPVDLQVMIRGDVKRKGALAPRGFLQVLCSSETQPWQVADTSGRRELAEAIVSPHNPLTARVIVNRIWGAIIGRPLVTTSSNFGRLGEEPSHPEVLDDLSVRFIESGWSIKWLIREIVLSSTYQQSSVTSEDIQTQDPDNIWLARMHRKRLPIEAWRDSILSSTGRLERTVGGPSINPQDPSIGRR
ncbi:MAG: PSD1 and planctomycete cytochrome C domain-containing protein, partial [Aureliella sp.]